MITRNGLSSRLARENSLATFGRSAFRSWPMLDADLLWACVRSQTALQSFEDPQIRNRLSVLVKGLHEDANLHLIGRFLVRMHLRNLLATRLLLTNVWADSQASNPEPVRRPVFITGMPRSGSTYLHELLAQGPDCRAPLVWEVMFPVSQARKNGTTSRRQIRRTAACLWWFRRISPTADAVHPLRATTPQECIAIHSHTLLSREFATTFHVPRYDDLLRDSDFSPAYAWEKRFLQHLQEKQPATRWILKAPDHVFTLTALFSVFPDAIIVQTHRDPLKVLKSSMQLAEVLRRTFARPEERYRIGQHELRLIAEGTNRISEFRDSHPEMADRFLDVNYPDLVGDPIGTVSRIFRQLGVRMTAAAAARLGDLASRRTRYAGPKVQTTLADFGIESGAAAQQFAGYCERFGLKSTAG